jgi:hypothetical protein
LEKHPNPQGLSDYSLLLISSRHIHSVLLSALQLLSTGAFPTDLILREESPV